MTTPIILTILTTILLFLDCLQTIQIAKHPEKWSEINVILGKHPTVKAVMNYFTICILSYIGLAAFALFLDNNAFANVVIIVNIITIAVELWCISNNIKNKIPLWQH